jgi:hypothetical protein
MRRLHRSYTAEPEVEGIGVEGRFRVELPFGKVEPRGYAEGARETIRGAGLERHTAFPPSRGDDQRLYEIALHPVEIGGLVMLVQQTCRNEEQPGLKRRPGVQIVVDVELLDFSLTGIVGRSHCMLPFEFGVKARVLIELIADADYGAREIGCRLRPLLGGTQVIDLAVAPQARLVPPRGSGRRSLLGCRRGRCRFRLGLRRLRCRWHDWRGRRVRFVRCFGV